jgi:ferredoxin-nitrite reductase
MPQEGKPMTNADKKEKLNKIEQAKAKKHPILLKQELEHFASMGWEAMDEFERDFGLKWLGFFHRTVTPASLCCGCGYPMEF